MWAAPFENITKTWFLVSLTDLTCSRRFSTLASRQAVSTTSALPSPFTLAASLSRRVLGEPCGRWQVRQASDCAVAASGMKVTPEDAERVSAAIQQALANDAPYELEMRTIRPDGEVISLFTNAVVLREGGRPVRMLGATVDISQLKRAEAALRTSETQFRTLANVIPQLAWMARPASTVSSRFRRMEVLAASSMPEANAPSFRTEMIT